MYADIKRVLLIFILLTATLAADVNLSSTPTDLVVWAETSKPDYRMCELVFVTIGVANVSEAPVLVPYPELICRLNLEATLLRPSGEHQRLVGLSRKLDREPIVLEPHDTITFCFDIMVAFGSIGMHNDLPGCLFPGDYEIELTYAEFYRLPSLKFTVLDTFAGDSKVIARINSALLSGNRRDEARNKKRELYADLMDSPFQSLVAEFILDDAGDSDDAKADLAIIRTIITDIPQPCILRRALMRLYTIGGKEAFLSDVNRHRQLVTESRLRHDLRLALHLLGKDALYEEIAK